MCDVNPWQVIYDVFVASSRKSVTLNPQATHPPPKPPLGKVERIVPDIECVRFPSPLRDVCRLYSCIASVIPAH